MKSKTLRIAEKYLKKIVEVIVDRPLGSTHPTFNKIIYPVNYGYIKDIVAPDGENLDAYLLKVNYPVKKYKGMVAAIIHRLTDDDDKLVIIPVGETITEEEIEKAVDFQEKWSRSKHIIIK